MKNLILKGNEKFEEFLVKRTEKCRYREIGVQYVYKFENNYGASIIKHEWSYGFEKDLWELAVIKFYRDKFDLVYDTEITDDVIGYLRDEEVIELLEKIKEL